MAAARTAASPDPARDSRIVKLMAEVSEERLAAIVAKLQGFGTRHTLSNATDPARGIGAARQWILDELKRASPRLQVAFDTHHIKAQGRITKDVELRNVVAILPGRTPRRVYITGHYDSLVLRRRPTDGAAPAAAGGATVSGSADYDIPAPGANDDASGTAVVIEAARVLARSGLEFDATLVFVAFAGEEQGLVGARQHARLAQEQKLVIDAVLNNDIVGNAVGGNGVVDDSSVRVFSDGPEDSPGRQLARYIHRQAALYVPGHRVRLIAREDRFGRGGDHSPFVRAGFAAVRVTESQENFARQHTPEDVAGAVSPPYLARNTRVNVAAAASLALAPAAPLVIVNPRRGPTIPRGQSRYDAVLTWQASAGAAGYRVFWREAWTPDWEHEVDAGNVTTFTRPGVSIDDYVFGVAAIGAGGHESLVSAFVRPEREDEER